MIVDDALGWTDAAGSTAPLASQFADEGGRLKISLAQSQAVPDPYGIRGPRSDGDEQSGWPGLAFSAMSAWLVAEKEDSLGEGLTAGTWPGGGAAARATQDGGSLYGAVVFTANGSVMRRQDLQASCLASVDRQNGQGLVAMYAVRDIYAHSELILTYGKDYCANIPDFDEYVGPVSK
jgi:hypothetical protein